MNVSILAALGFCLLYGLQIVLQSLYLRGSIHPIQLMFLTNATSFFLLSVFHGSFNRQIFRVTVPKRTLSFFLIATALWIVADMSSMIGLATSSSVNLSLLSRLQVFITYLGAILFLRESVSSKKIIAVFLAFVGSLLTVFRGQSLVFSSGDILFLVFTVAISISGLFRQKTAEHMSTHQMTYLMYGISAATTGAATLVIAPIQTIAIWGFILANAVLALLGFTCVNYAIGKGGASQFSLISCLLPFITAIFSFIILHELPSVYQLAGGMIIVASIILFIGTSWKRKNG